MRPAALPAAGSSWAPSLVGALAVAVALAEAEVMAGVTRTASLVNAIGSLLIALEPPGAKDVAVGLFGDGDKAVLILGVVAGLVGIGAVLGRLAVDHRRAAGVGTAVLAATVVAAVARVPQSGLGTALVATALAGAAGALAIRGLSRVAGEPPWRSHAASESTPDQELPSAEVSVASRAEPGATATTGAAGAPRPTADAVWDRRRFLIASAATLTAAAAGGAIGRQLLDEAPGDAVVTSTRLPAALVRAVDPGPAEHLDIPGLTPVVTPADGLYRVDTALQIPDVDVADWRLEVIGLVDNPLALTYDDLLAMPLYEAYVTLACVSNEVGGHLVGSPLWTGVRLKDVLAEARVRAGATQIMARSWSDFSAGFPTSWAMAEGREPLIAVGMDRQVLPAQHGFPARLVVPGLYGYVSATKWLTQIELTTREAQDGFWIPLGWAKDGPMLTQSRIDVPRHGAILEAGVITVAGVAWAGDRGISAVELRADGGPWTSASMSAPLSTATWVQWSAAWVATSGQHVLEVRATDGTGAVQIDEISRPAPDGARGHHRITVTVS